MKITKSKLYMTGISISLALALTACGGSDTNVSQSGVQTLGESITLETRASSTEENPINLILVNVEESNATLEFDGFRDSTIFATTDGVAIAYAKLPSDLISGSDESNYSIAEDNSSNIPKEFWKKVQYGWGVKTLATDDDTNRTQLTITDLEPNQIYAFRIASINSDENNTILYSGSGNWSQIVTQGKTLAGIPSPEITVRSACMYDNEQCQWVNGAKIEWTLPEVLNAVNIYREELNSEDNSTKDGTFTTLATELDCENEYNDTNVTEGSTYRYTVEGYNTNTGIYADKNSTVNATIESM